MKFVARATSVEEFNNWVNVVRQSPNQLTLLSYAEISQPNMNNDIQYFSSASDDLFSNVVMKSMMPMDNMMTASNKKLNEGGKL